MGIISESFFNLLIMKTCIFSIGYLLVTLTLSTAFVTQNGLKQFPKGLRRSKHVVESLIPAAENLVNDKTTAECSACLMVTSSSNSVSSSTPWLYNSAQFWFSHIDSEGYRVFQANVPPTSVYYLHFYDEGLFYDGFWVVNDTPGQYIEESGRVFVYNSDYDECPSDTGANWYYYIDDDWSTLTPSLSGLVSKK